MQKKVSFHSDDSCKNILHYLNTLMWRIHIFVVQILPETGINFAHHLYSSRCKQTQAIQFALSLGG